MKLTKFNKLLITHWGSLATRNLSQGVRDLCSRHDLERHPYSMGDPVVQLTVVLKSSKISWSAHYLWGNKWWTNRFLDWHAPLVLNCWARCMSVSFSTPSLRRYCGHCLHEQGLRCSQYHSHYLHEPDLGCNSQCLSKPTTKQQVERGGTHHHTPPHDYSQFILCFSKVVVWSPLDFSVP